MSHSRLYAGIILSIVLLWTLPGCETSNGASPLPERIVSKRIRILDSDEYKQLRNEWEAYTQRNPGDPMGWTELAKAMRYAGEPCDEYLAIVRKAISVDPNYAEAHAVLGGYMYKQYCPTGIDDPREAIRELELALALDPDACAPHYSLWTLCYELDEYAKAEEHLRTLIVDHHLPDPLIDLAYNMLVGVEENAIILTNGDNDTYPPLALQAARGFRTDVAIVNLSLLNIEWYREEMRSGPHAVPIPDLTNSRHQRKDAAAVAGLIENLATDDWKRPLYIATTVYLSRFEISNVLSLEGTVYRILPEKGEHAVDLDRLEKNLYELYRMESSSSVGFDWEDYSALRMLVMNYAALYSTTASARWEEGDREGSRKAMTQSLELCEFQNYREMGLSLAEHWLSREENSPEAKRWISKFTDESILRR